MTCYMPLKSQVFYRLGYNFGKVITPEFNETIDLYNSNRPYLDKKMNHLGILHGLVIGIGLKFPESPICMEFTWSNSHNVVSATGTDPNTNALRTRYVKYRHNCLSYALQFQIKSLPVLWWGFSIDVSRYSQYTRLDTTNHYSWMDKSIMVEDRLFVVYELPVSKKIALQVQPYFQFAWPLLHAEYSQFVDLALDVPYWEGYSLYSIPKNFGLLLTVKLGGDNE